MSKLGLRIEDGLDCPAGGYHEVPATRLPVIAATGGGTAACVKCKQVLSLVRAT